MAEVRSGADAQQRVVGSGGRGDAAGGQPGSVRDPPVVPRRRDHDLPHLTRARALPRFDVGAQREVEIPLFI